MLQLGSSSGSRARRVLGRRLAPWAGRSRPGSNDYPCSWSMLPSTREFDQLRLGSTDGPPRVRSRSDPRAWLSPDQLAAETEMCRGRALSALGIVTVRMPWENDAETCVLSTRSGRVTVRVQRPERPFLAAIALVGDPLGPLPLAAHRQRLAGDRQVDFLGQDARQLGRQDVMIARIVEIQRRELTLQPPGMVRLQALEQTAHLALEVAKRVPATLPVQSTHRFVSQPRILKKRLRKLPP